MEYAITYSLLSFVLMAILHFVSNEHTQMNKFKFLAILSIIENKYYGKIFACRRLRKIRSSYILEYARN